MGGIFTTKLYAEYKTTPITNVLLVAGIWFLPVFINAIIIYVCNKVKELCICF
jgi:hypothetical protein